MDDVMTKPKDDKPEFNGPSDSDAEPLQNGPVAKKGKTQAAAKETQVNGKGKKTKTKGKGKGGKGADTAKTKTTKADKTKKPKTK